MSVHWSLGHFLEEGYRIVAYCPNGHGADIDLARAIEVFGADFVVSRQRPRLCGTSGENGTPGVWRVISVARCPHSLQTKARRNGGGPPHR